MGANELLKSITEIGAVSGDEFRLSNFIKNIFAKFGHEMFVDRIGNLIIKIKGKSSSKKMMIFSHIDEPGLVVTNIDRNGFLDFDIVGDLRPKDLASQEVYVWGKKPILGLLGLKPPHILYPEERKASVVLDDMKIDVGFSRKEALRYIDIGDTVTFKTKCLFFRDNMLCAKALCDRVGIAVLYKTLSELRNVDMEVYVVLGVQHYNDYMGARVAVNEIKPDIALVLDTIEGKTRENPYENIRCGFGPVVYSGPTVNSILTQWLIQCARSMKSEFKYQVKAISAENLTDGWVIQVACGGIPVAILSIPIMYKYCSAEIVKILDLDYTSKLLLDFIYSSDKKNWGELNCF